MRAIILVFINCLVHALWAQTGPGGVGNSTSNVLWLSADTLVYDAGGSYASTSDPVAVWGDRSGNGNDAAQSLNGNRPDFYATVVNNQPVIRFTSSSNDLLLSTGVTTSNQASVWAVAAYTSLPSSNPGILIGAPAGSGATVNPGDKSIGMWVASSNGRIWGRGVQSNNSTINLPANHQLNASTFFIVSNFYRTANIQQYVNNTQVGSVTSDGTLKSWTDISIGRQGTESWQGDIAEVIFYNTEVNEAQRIIVDNYLAAKYGLSLSSADLYEGDSPANGNYDFEVAGIGRINSSNQHTAAKGSGVVRIQNASNLNNGEFLIWGHNNGTPHTIEFSDVPPGIVARWERDWYVSSRNTSGNPVSVGTVTVRFYLNGYAPLTTSDIRLLVDTDGDGLYADETPVSGATMISAGVYQFTGVTLGDGDHFTIATANYIQTPLPVNLLSFTATPANMHVLLEWSAASEINHDKFEIYRSANGREWINIGTVNGNGNNNAIAWYHYYDETPLPGTNYYRLKQIDKDGKHAFSSMVAVQIAPAGHPVLKVYPNPVTGKDMLTVEGINEKPQIFNTAGIEVTMLVSITGRGKNNINLDVSALPAGNYIIMHRSDRAFFTRL